MHGVSLGQDFLVFSALDQVLVRWVSIKFTGSLAQAIHVEDVNEFSFDLDHLGALKAAKESADGFKRQSQVIPDFLAGKAQVKFFGRKAAGLKTSGEIEEEAREALFGRALAGRKALDGEIKLLTGPLQNDVLNRGDLLPEEFQIMRREFAVTAGFKGDQGAAVFSGIKTIKPDEFTRKQHGNDRFPADRIGVDEFGGTRFKGIDAGKAFTGPIDDFALPKGAVAFDDVADGLDLVGIHPARDTDAGEVAVATGDFLSRVGYTKGTFGHLSCPWLFHNDSGVSFLRQFT